MADLKLTKTKSCPALSPGPCLIPKTPPSFWTTKKPQVTVPVWSPTPPRVEMKKKDEVEHTKSPKRGISRSVKKSRVPPLHIPCNESIRRGNTLHEAWGKSYNSLSSDEDNFVDDDDDDGEGKKYDRCRGKGGKPPGINTRYIDDFRRIWDEASLAGSRCSNSTKLDTPRSRRSWISDPSFSPMSDSESLDVRRYRDLRGSDKASTPRLPINIADFGDGKDYYVGLASQPRKYRLERRAPTSVILPSSDYPKGQTPPSQCSRTYNLSTTSTTTGTTVLPKTPTAAMLKDCPIDKIPLTKSSPLISVCAAGIGDRKNAQSIGLSREEYLYEDTIKPPKPLKSMSLPIGNSSTIKTVDLPKPERKKLKCCTLEDIIQRINHPFWSDGRTKRILFICYRAFCTRGQLFAALEKFYEDPKLPPDFYVWNDSKRPNAIVKAKRLMRIKLLNLIRYWLREFFYDFDNDDLQRVHKWTSRILATGDDTTTKCVKSVLREMSLIRSGKRHRVASKIFLCDYPDTLYKEHKTPETIFDVRSEEIARQMCLIDHEIFSSIRPHEFLGQSWKKKNSHIQAPNIIRLIQHFNQVSSWCQAMILYQRNLRKRAYVLGRLLKICFYLDRLENLNSFCAIMSGIRSTPIFRLKKTFKSLKPKRAKLLRDFQEMLKTDKNHKNLRDRMAILVEPGIPHIGLLLQDILSIDNGNDNSKEEKINFSKYSLLNDRIEWCLQFQAYPFHFRQLEKVQEELRRCYHRIPNDFLYNLSLILEPRED